MRKALLALALAAMGCTAVQAKLPGGISGTWYNPDQNGHGLSVNLVDDGLAIVIWHTFDPDGNPLTLYIQGPVHGRTITGVAYAPRGMQFGSFDPAALQLPVWGEVVLEFNDCQHASLRWSAGDAAYGSGEIAIERLTFVHGVDCDLPPINPLPTGLYAGTFSPATNRNGGHGVGIVDLEGRLWALEHLTVNGDEIPVAGNWDFHRSQVVLARPTEVLGERVEVAVAVHSNLWVASSVVSTAAIANVAATPGHWLVSGTQVAGSFEAGGGLAIRPQHWVAGAPVGMSLVQPIGVTHVTGDWGIRIRDQFFERSATLRVAADGSACINALPWESPDCDFRGTLRTPEGDVGLIDFEFRSTANPALPAYRGRGWLANVDGAFRLFLVGSNGTGGFGMAGSR
jgi:hypothetical protein